MENKSIKVAKHSTIMYNNLFDAKYEIGVRIQDFGVSIEEHYHNYFEIVCQLNGHSTQVINGVNYTLNARQFVIIHPGDSHENVATESTVLNLIVSEKYLSNLVIDSTFDDSIIHIKNVITNQKQIDVYQMPTTTWLLINDIYYLMLDQAETTMYYLRQKINFTSFLISLEEVEGIMEQQTNHNQFDLISYIEKNIATASLNDFSRLCNYSPSLISQRIKSQYEMSFIEILQELKLKHSVRLLTTTNLNIDQIVELVGYNNKTHFYNIFKEKYNTTPSKYRKAH